MQRTIYTICELTKKEKHDILRKYVPEIDVKKFKKEIEELKNKNSVLNKNVKKISSENLMQSKQIQELTDKNQELVNKNQDITNKSKELTNKNQELTNKNQWLTNKIKLLTNKNQELTNEIKWLTNKDQEKDKIITSLRAEIEKLKANASQPSQMPSDKELVVKEITDSWEEIIKSINNGTYRYKYQIGNYKPLSFGKFGTVNMQIAAFDADELADGSGKAPVTWISKEILTQHRMNVKTAVGGWEYSEMIKFLYDEIRPLIPETVRSAIKTVKKYTYTYRYENGRKQKNGITEDALWIPSIQEIFGDFSEGEVSAVYYNVLFSNNALRVKTYNKYAAWWWLRSAFNYASFSYVYTDGSSNFSNANYTGGVALGFCM